MINDEILKECNSQYSIIKSATERLEELRAICKHEKTHECLYGESLRNARPSIVCSYCNEWVAASDKPPSFFIKTEEPKTYLEKWSLPSQ